MNPRTRLTLICLGLNLLAGAVLCTPFLFWQTGDAPIYWGMALLVIAALSLFTQLVIGIIFALQAQRKILGQAMLLSIGLILLMGGSVCGTILMSI